MVFVHGLCTIQLLPSTGVLFTTRASNYFSFHVCMVLCSFIFLSLWTPAWEQASSCCWEFSSFCQCVPSAAGAPFLLLSLVIISVPLPLNLNLQSCLLLRISLHCSLNYWDSSWVFFFFFLQSYRLYIINSDWNVCSLHQHLFLMCFKSIWCSVQFRFSTTQGSFTSNNLSNH